MREQFIGMKPSDYKKPVQTTEELKEEINSLKERMRDVPPSTRRTQMEGQLRFLAKKLVSRMRQ